MKAVVLAKEELQSPFEKLCTPSDPVGLFGVELNGATVSWEQRREHIGRLNETRALAFG